MSNLDTLVGRTIGGYEIEELIGHGSYNNVWLGVNPLDSSKAAIRLLSSTRGMSEKMSKKIGREIGTLGRLQHPNIVQLKGSGYIDLDDKFRTNYPYMVMEYIPGGTLAQRVRREGPLDEDSLIQLASQTLGALEYIHDEGVLHGDIHEGNILFDEDGNAILADFGLSKIIQQAEEARHSGGNSSAHARYASHEIFNNRERDERTDLFSWACTMYYAATGISPGGNPPSLRIEAPDISQDIIDIIEKSRSYHMADRHQSAADVLDGINGILKQRDQYQIQLSDYLAKMQKLMATDGLLHPYQIDDGFQLLRQAEKVLTPDHYGTLESILAHRKLKDARDMKKQPVPNNQDAKLLLDYERAERLHSWSGNSHGCGINNARNLLRKFAPQGDIPYYPRTKAKEELAVSQGNPLIYRTR